eukprot:5742088-Pyramimonas_sp.AAC.1
MAHGKSGPWDCLNDGSTGTIIRACSVSSAMFMVPLMPTCGAHGPRKSSSSSIKAANSSDITP